MMMEIVGWRGVVYSPELGSASHQDQVVESSLGQRYTSRAFPLVLLDNGPCWGFYLTCMQSWTNYHARDAFASWKLILLHAIIHVGFAAATCRITACSTIAASRDCPDLSCALLRVLVNLHAKLDQLSCKGCFCIMKVDFASCHHPCWVHSSNNRFL